MSESIAGRAPKPLRFSCNLDRELARDVKRKTRINKNNNKNVKKETKDVKK